MTHNLIDQKNTKNYKIIYAVLTLSTFPMQFVHHFLSPFEGGGNHTTHANATFRHGPGQSSNMFKHGCAVACSIRYSSWGWCDFWLADIFVADFNFELENNGQRVCTIRSFLYSKFGGLGGPNASSVILCRQHLPRSLETGHFYGWILARL